MFKSFVVVSMFLVSGYVNAGEMQSVLTPSESTSFVRTRTVERTVAIPVAPEVSGTSTPAITACDPVTPACEPVAPACEPVAVERKVVTCLPYCVEMKPMRKVERNVHIERRVRDKSIQKEVKRSHKKLSGECACVPCI